MIDAIVVFCSCRDETEADRIAAGLLERRLAACVTVLPAVKSIYRWRGNVESSQEVFLIIKAAKQSLPELNDFVLSTHSYDTPEVLAVPVVGGSERYLAWIAAESGES